MIFIMERPLRQGKMEPQGLEKTKMNPRRRPPKAPEKDPLPPLSAILLAPE